MAQDKVDKQREHSKKSYWKNPERSRNLARERAAKKRESNREEYNRKMREYNAANRERINSIRRERRKNDSEHAEIIRARDRARSPEQRRNALLKRTYGLTLSGYSELLASQDGKCAICGATKGDSIGRNFHVDHCHATGAVRGLLCTECNTGLGKFKDNSALLSRAIEYLKGD